MTRSHPGLRVVRRRRRRPPSRLDAWSAYHYDGGGLGAGRCGPWTPRRPSHTDPPASESSDPSAGVRVRKADEPATAAGDASGLGFAARGTPPGAPRRWPRTTTRIGRGATGQWRRAGAAGSRGAAGQRRLAGASPVAWRARPSAAPDLQRRQILSGARSSVAPDLQRRQIFSGASGTGGASPVAPCRRCRWRQISEQSGGSDG
jgi:hypothetical protein